MDRVQFSTPVGILPFIIMFRLVLEPIKPSVEWIQGVLFSWRVKGLEHKGDITRV
jgi:hypothetical protein